MRTSRSAVSHLDGLSYNLKKYFKEFFSLDETPVPFHSEGSVTSSAGNKDTFTPISLPTEVDTHCAKLFSV
jgi:hypothetical protein